MRIFKSFVVPAPERKEKVRAMYHTVRRIARELTGVGIFQKDAKVACHRKINGAYEIAIYLSDDLFSLFRENQIEHI